MSEQPPWLFIVGVLLAECYGLGSVCLWAIKRTPLWVTSWWQFTGTILLGLLINVVLVGTCVGVYELLQFCRNVPRKDPNNKIAAQEDDIEMVLIVSPGWQPSMVDDR